MLSRDSKPVKGVDELTSREHAIYVVERRSDVKVL
jgi:hypothetical protein